VTDNIELVLRFHPVGGEDVTVMSADFADETQAVEAIAQAIHERHGLILTRARYNRETSENPMVINLANIVSARVSTKDTNVTGQYL
jgi:phosphoketolase